MGRCQVCCPRVNSGQARLLWRCSEMGAGVAGEREGQGLSPRGEAPNWPPLLGCLEQVGLSSVRTAIPSRVLEGFFVCV